MLRVTLRTKHQLRAVNFCFAKVINFLPGSYQNVCSGGVTGFGYTKVFMPFKKGYAGE
jgi:hypothetical protein